MGILDSLSKLFSKSAKNAAPKKGTKKAKAKTAPTDGISLKAVPKEAKAIEPKKAAGFHSAPVDESALGFSISIKDEQAAKRNAIRVEVKGLTVFVHRLNKPYRVADISATGIGFRFEKPRVKGGVQLKMDLLLDGKKEIEGVTAKVMRHEQGVVGCAFVDLDRHQEDAVSRLVLMGQKQQAARKATHGEQPPKKQG